ncbi:hypothetical protein ABPG74_022430 [Tetrahymena malaccensis]
MRNTFLLCILLIAGVSCWWDGGHMMTAEIAKQEILARNATLYELIEKYVTILNPLCDARSQDFVQAASWADDIKDDAMNFWYGWHFYDKPENTQGLYVILDQDNQVYNSITGIKRAIQELSRKYYLPLQNNLNISVQQAIMMRLLIHIVGDMHQPLHNVNMYNYTYTTGDLGGNKEKILLLNKTSMILHSYFDSGATRLDSFPRPLTQEKLSNLSALAYSFRTQYPRSYFGQRMNVTTPEQWAQESFDIAHNFIYPFVSQTNQITPDWDTQAYELIKQQLALGGYRLADILLGIFQNQTAPVNQTNSTSTQTNSTSNLRKTIIA